MPRNQRYSPSWCSMRNSSRTGTRARHRGRCTSATTVVAVVGMDVLHPAPGQQSSEAAAGQLGPALIEVVDRPVRTGGPDAGRGDHRRRAGGPSGSCGHPCRQKGETANLAAECGGGKSAHSSQWRRKPLRHTLFGCHSWTPRGSAPPGWSWLLGSRWLLRPVALQHRAHRRSRPLCRDGAGPSLAQPVACRPGVAAGNRRGLGILLVAGSRASPSSA